MRFSSASLALGARGHLLSICSPERARRGSRAIRSGPSRTDPQVCRFAFAAKKSVCRRSSAGLLPSARVLHSSVSRDATVCRRPPQTFAQTPLRPPPSQVAANLQSGPPESPKVVRLGSARLNWARNNAQAEGDAQRRGHRSARVGRHAISAPEAVSHLTIVGFVWRRIGRLCSVPCATLRLLPFWLCGRLFTAPQPLQTALCAHALNCPSVRTPVRRPSKWVRSERRSMGVTLEPKAAHAMNGHNSARSSGGRKCVYLRPLTWPAAAHVRARASRTL